MEGCTDHVVTHYVESTGSNLVSSEMSVHVVNNQKVFVKYQENQGKSEKNSQVVTLPPS